MKTNFTQVFFICQHCDVADFVKGEESASFTNTLGECITVKVCESEELTSQLLTTVS